VTTVHTPGGDARHPTGPAGGAPARVATPQHGARTPDRVTAIAYVLVAIVGSLYLTGSLFGALLDAQWGEPEATVNRTSLFFFFVLFYAVWAASCKTITRALRYLAARRDEAETPLKSDVPIR